MKKILTLAALLTVVLAVCGQPTPQRTNDTLTRTVIYRPGDYGSTNYRIPAIITAKDGSLVIATDKRKFNEGDLPEDIDIVCNRSTDGGHSWSEQIGRASCRERV